MEDDCETTGSEGWIGLVGYWACTCTCACGRFVYTLMQTFAWLEVWCGADARVSESGWVYECTRD